MIFLVLNILPMSLVLRSNLSDNSQILITAANLEGLCVGGVGGLCPAGLCPGSLSPRVFLSGRPPVVKSGQSASYLKAFLLSKMVSSYRFTGHKIVTMSNRTGAKITHGS